MDGWMDGWMVHCKPLGYGEFWKRCTTMPPGVSYDNNHHSRRVPLFTTLAQALVSPPSIEWKHKYLIQTRSQRQSIDAMCEVFFHVLCVLGNSQKFGNPRKILCFVNDNSCIDPARDIHSSSDESEHEADDYDDDDEEEDDRHMTH